jgi:hypothetical protein
MRALQGASPSTTHDAMHKGHSFAYWERDRRRIPKRHRSLVQMRAACSIEPRQLQAFLIALIAQNFYQLA